MLAIVATILFVLSRFVHGAGGAHVPAWFNAEGLALAGLAFLALSLIWHPVIPVRRPQ